MKIFFDDSSVSKKDLEALVLRRSKGGKLKVLYQVGKTSRTRMNVRARPKTPKGAGAFKLTSPNKRSTAYFICAIRHSIRPRLSFRCKRLEKLGKLIGKWSKTSAVRRERPIPTYLPA